ncbi:MAG: hypothetical protein OQL19_03750 [Gammaproteobacteria bacterium]|nr:hypothetical protein [Gammaproteobacteria bacterium]
MSHSIISFEKQMFISHEHPSLTGHFPNNPIVPGVVILDQVIRKWQEKTRRSIKHISNTKFIQLLRADIQCTIFYNKAINDKTINFQIVDNAQTVIAKGSFSYE